MKSKAHILLHNLFYATQEEILTYHIVIGAELGGAAGARAPPVLHNPRKFIV